jgi:hypothetical protein
VINKIKDKIRKKDILVLLEKIIPERNDENKYDIKEEIFEKWRKKGEKLRKSQTKFKKEMEIIEKKEYNININISNNIMLVKKLFSNLPKIKAKLFIKKLGKIRINKNKNERIKTDLKKAKNDILEQNKSQVLNKIYKIYANHKISNMFNTLNNNLIKKESLYMQKNS